jgi:hypothetical protein
MRLANLGSALPLFCALLLRPEPQQEAAPNRAPGSRYTPFENGLKCVEVMLIPKWI